MRTIFLVVFLTAFSVLASGQVAPRWVVASLKTGTFEGIKFSAVNVERNTETVRLLRRVTINIDGATIIAEDAAIQNGEIRIVGNSVVKLTTQAAK